jgi:hypothetical protein
MRWIVMVLLAACGSTAPRPQYLKGALHVHTSNSGDSQTPPAAVARWYAAHGFDFIVLTDHNHISSLPSAPLLVVPGVELTQNLETCDPPPAENGFGCLLHVNAIAVTPGPFELPFSHARIDAYAAALDVTAKLGGIAQLNHPNFHWGADASLMIELARRGLVLFEVSNMSSDVANDGDATHPSTEALWDTVLTSGATMYGTATDDAHSYNGTGDVGDRGWVMVHADRNAASIRDALARGDFYSSTGIVLRRIDRAGGTLAIEAEEVVDVTFIGTAGKVLSRVHGQTASETVSSGYVRADVIDARGRRAWVQPLRL